MESNPCPGTQENLPDPQVYWPGDLPLPEIAITLGFVAAGLCAFVGVMLWLASLRLPRLLRSAKRTLLGASVPLVLSLPFYYPIYERNVGRWAGLKAFLQTREAALQKYRAAHPTWSPRQVTDGFRRTDPGPWEYRLDPRYGCVVVYPTIFIRDPPRMAVNFGGLGADIAFFDPDTMWVDNSM